MDPDPETRMTCKDALKHPWLKNRRDVEERIRRHLADASSSNSTARAGPSTESMAANPGSYLDAEQEAQPVVNNAIPRTSLTADFEQIQVDEGSNPVTPVVPQAPRPSQNNNRLERRPMEIARLDERGNLGSFELIEAYDDPSTPQANGAGPSGARANLKRKDRSESMDEDYEMGRASEAGSDNSMGTTPIPGGDGSEATTPVEERNARTRANNKRSRGD